MGIRDGGEQTAHGPAGARWARGAARSAFLRRFFSTKATAPASVIVLPAFLRCSRASSGDSRNFRTLPSTIALMNMPAVGGGATGVARGNSNRRRRRRRRSGGSPLYRQRASAAAHRRAWLFSTADRRRAIVPPVSIYATLWKLRFPEEGDYHSGCGWITVTAQGVPPHVGSPSPGAGYETGDPFADFLPPPVELDEESDAPHLRAVVIVTEHTLKGTSRNGQEYVSPLLVLTGEEYARITFEDLYERICAALRGNRAPVVAEIIRPDGTKGLIRDRGVDDGAGRH